jgi:hypothetical protein
MGIPPHLLRAISHIESGRQVQGARVAWPLGGQRRRRLGKTQGTGRIPRDKKLDVMPFNVGGWLLSHPTR